MHRGRMYYTEYEDHVEHHAQPRPATTSNTRRSIRVSKYKDRHSETEQTSDSKLPEPTKDDKPPGGDREQRGDAKMSSEQESLDQPDHFDFRPDTRSGGSNPADHEPIPKARNAYYPKYCIDEFEDLDDYTKTYVRYRIAGGRMKFKESDTGSEGHYTRFPGIELDEIGDWSEDRNNIAPCEWSMGKTDYVKWFLSNHPKPVDIRQATRFWLDRREMLWRRQHPAPGSYEEFLQSSEFGPGEKYEGGYNHIAHPEDTWDQYHMHMIRLQAAISLRLSTIHNGTRDRQPSDCHT